MSTRRRVLSMASLIGVLTLLVSGLYRYQIAEASAPIYYNNTNYNGANIHYVKVDLSDTNTFVYPQGAFNHLPEI